MVLVKLPVPGRRVGQGPTALAVGAGGDCLNIFTLVYHFSFLSSSVWETARYRLKYCLKGPLSRKQPTNQPIPESGRKKRELIDERKNNPTRTYCKRSLGPCHTIRRSGTGRFPSTIAPPDMNIELVATHLKPYG